VAMQAALLLDDRVAGVVALSTWLGQPPKLAGATKTGLPLLVCHGGADMFVPARFGREVKETLNRLGLATMLKTYPMMGHAFCAQVRQPLLLCLWGGGAGGGGLRGQAATVTQACSRELGPGPGPGRRRRAEPDRSHSRPVRARREPTGAKPCYWCSWEAAHCPIRMPGCRVFNLLHRQFTIDPVARWMEWPCDWPCDMCRSSWTSVRSYCSMSPRT
jgi:hypothetical protein